MYQGCCKVEKINNRCASKHGDPCGRHYYTRQPRKKRRIVVATPAVAMQNV